MKISYTYNDGGRSNYFDDRINGMFNVSICDCVTRAIAIIENIDYLEAYNLVSSYLKKNKTPDQGIKNTIVKNIFKDLGYVFVKKENGKMFKFHELPKDKKIVIHVNKHICVFQNMITEDLFCLKENECVHWYFVKNKS